MIQIIKSNKEQYEYDIQAMLKSFYPEWEPRMLAPGSEVRDRRILEGEPVMELFFGETEVTMRMLKGLHNSNLKAGEGKNEAGGVYVWHPKELADTPAYKNAFKQFLYTSLREETGMSLPWGNLTGIRPTKIAMTMMEQGKRGEEIADYLRTMHLVSEEKTALALEIAERERQILSTLHYEDGYSLYVGIPFCPTTCLYCSFTSYPISAWKKRVGEYLTALEREIDAVALFCRNKILDTVYIGGGTPTALSAEELTRLLKKVKSAVDSGNGQ